MTLSILDKIIFVGYFVVVLLICAVYTRRAGRSIQDFFLSGRNLPWYIAGTSMIATTFAADTPLGVTEWVAQNGVAGNWFWWNFVLGGTLTVFFFSRLWRRAGILTDLEFVELRYSGKPAAFLRGFRSIYLGLFINSVIIAWVNLAMFTILNILLGWENKVLVVALCMAFVTIYSTMSGIWGAAIADALHFVTAMVGCICLAVVAVMHPDVGGLAGLKAKLPEETLHFLPSIGDFGSVESVTGMLKLSIPAMLAYIGIQWWASWYPGAEPGGGGYIAQRMMSAKDEKHSLLATLWFTIGHYCLRPWPWILVALVSLVLYPELGPTEKKEGFVMTMRDILPVGLKGLLLAAFFAAYMSTIATQLNLGTSYLINDLYKRFMRPGASDRHYVIASRFTTVLMMAVALYITTQLQTIKGAWAFVIECGAGVGLVMILRWFWWRVNAWSEILGMVAPFIAYTYIKYGPEGAFLVGTQFPESLYPIVLFTTVVWVTGTLLTAPVTTEHLKAFYRKVHPGGVGWTEIARQCPDVKGDTGFGALTICWLASAGMVYSILFGIGKLLFLETALGLGFLALAAVMGWIIHFTLNRTGWEKVVK
ncbi:MAG: sodium:solute symporter family protein [Gemmatimonadota bacterium]|nr:sodium:solute symporter family protein [Gemmatimonadota bacterium]